MRTYGKLIINIKILIINLQLKEQWLRDVIGPKLSNGLPSYDIEVLKIKDSIITADALLCQKEIAKKIAKANDHILALRGNHPLMEQEVKEFFLSPATSTRSVHTNFDKGHGRTERQIYTLDTTIG